MTLVCVICCRKYDKNQDFENDNKDFVNKAIENKVKNLQRIKIKFS